MDYTAYSSSPVHADFGVANRLYKGEMFMRILSVANYNAVSFHAARLISAQVLTKPNAVLGLATGSSPEGAYRQLIADCKDNLLDFSRIHTVNLDEYWDMEPSHPQSYRYFMNEKLFNHINIDLKNTHTPNGKAENPDKECQDYSEMITNMGGIDLQVIGIGSNGHIGFNEPGEHFSAGTHLQSLKAETREDNKRFFDSLEDVPTHALTMGIREIMQARAVVMIASGKNKAQAVHDMLLGNICPQCPASILQLHPNFTLIADMEAMSIVNQN